MQDQQDARRDARAASADGNSGSDFKRQADGDGATTADSFPQRSTPADATDPATDSAPRDTSRTQSGGKPDDGSKNTVPNVR